MGWSVQWPQHTERVPGYGSCRTGSDSAVSLFLVAHAQLSCVVSARQHRSLQHHVQLGWAQQPV